MSDYKRVFRNNLPKRLSHQEYQTVVRERKKYSRILGTLIACIGFTSIASVFTAILTLNNTPFTQNIYIDIFIFIFILGGGIFFIIYARYLVFRFPCRFCLKDNPEGSTYCLSCNSDMLSNENLPEHEQFFESKNN